MRLLLDTHIMLWMLDDDARLAPAARRAIEDADRVFVSAATVWEIAIKRRLGKLDAPDSLIELIEGAGLDRLPIIAEHGMAAGALPNHHRDPFDRMLVAQARVEGLTLVTADPHISKYDVPVLVAM